MDTVRWTCETIFEPECLVSRFMFGCPTLHYPAHSPHSSCWIWCSISHSRLSILFLLESSGAVGLVPTFSEATQQLCYRWRSLRRDPADRESAILKLFRWTGASYNQGNPMNQLMFAPLFPYALYWCSRHVLQGERINYFWWKSHVWPNDDVTQGETVLRLFFLWTNLLQHAVTAEDTLCTQDPHRLIRK